MIVNVPTLAYMIVQLRWTEHPATVVMKQCVQHVLDTQPLSGFFENVQGFTHRLPSHDISPCDWVVSQLHSGGYSVVTFPLDLHTFVHCVRKRILGRACGGWSEFVAGKHQLESFFLQPSRTPRP